MSDFTITLTEEERIELARILDHQLEDVRVEVHRTHTPEYRERVESEEKLIRKLRDKLHRAEVQTQPS